MNKEIREIKAQVDDGFKLCEELIDLLIPDCPEKIGLKVSLQNTQDDFLSQDEEFFETEDRPAIRFWIAEILEHTALACQSLIVKEDRSERVDL